jgi:hypothetical protein
LLAGGNTYRCVLSSRRENFAALLCLFYLINTGNMC